jgi:alpha-galactosidase
MNVSALDLCLGVRLGLQLSADGKPLASAALGIWGDGRSLLERAEAMDEKLTSDGASVTYALGGGGRLRADLLLASVGRADAVRLQWTITNIGRTEIAFDRVAAPVLRLDRQAFPLSRRLWTMQGAAVKWGQDFAFPLPSGFARDNYLGHLQDAEGGGIPVVYFWNRDRGLALMHIDPQPRDWYMPVAADKQRVTAALELRLRIELQPGGSLTGPAVVLSVHQGDFFEPLALYRELLAAQGVRSPQPIEVDYEPAWCSWGYEFDVRPAEVMAVLPVLKQMGIRWLTLDDRWFDAYGDWNPRRDTFPRGADDLRAINSALHAVGCRSTLWWYPLCVEDGHGRWDSHVYAIADLYRAHPDWLVHNADGTVARNNRHLAMLCPALPEVQAHVAALTRRFITDWGFDGHKLDNIYTVPACFNPAHHHQRPEESTAAMAEAYRIIFETTRRLKPESVTQICPCGTPITLHLLPWTDQTVTADPTSSAQIRQRIKFYKALAGPRTAVFADHVELSDGGADFASEIGPGGVPGTKFIWPADSEVRARLKEDWALTPEKLRHWTRWFGIYNLHRPAKGEYLNLYDLGFDRPEGHVLRRDERLYYAFFAEAAGRRWKGRVPLRGLGARTYQLWDYVTERELGRAAGPGEAMLEASFDGSLLLVAIPLTEKA